MWNERYADTEYAYGREPNDFLRNNASALKPGSVLCIAEGEGRNAVFLAGLGFEVTAMDASSVGLEKARRLAAENGVSINTVTADMQEFDFGEDAFDNIISVFAHVPPPVRKAVHRQLQVSLTPGGVFLLEAYTPAQLEYKTGGPPVAEMMMDLATLKQELIGLEMRQGREVVRDIHEGVYHDGPGAVVQVLAVNS